MLVTAFTIGHSFTLALSILDVVRLPSKLVEILIPVTILITALDNLLFRGKRKNLMTLNYMLALCFGLIHGMGFANSARMMISSEETIAVPLLGFNIGLELGQIAVVILVSALHFLLSRFLKLNDRYWILVISVITALLSVKMIIERIFEN